MSQQRKSATALLAANAIPEERILDAAYDQLLAVGMRRLNMADIARQADVSRATLYRRWPNVQALLAALVTREFAAVLSSVPNPDASARAVLVHTVVGAVARLRSHPLLRKIVDVDPEFLVPYLLHRRGTTSDHQLALVESGVRAGQADGSIRAGAPGMLARAVLLTAWSFTLTGPVFVARSRLRALDAELTELLDRYLVP